MATHKGVQLTSMGVGRLYARVLAAYPTRSWLLGRCVVTKLVYRITPHCTVALLSDG